MRFACCITEATHTPRICDTSCFTVAKMFTKMHLNFVYADIPSLVSSAECNFITLQRIKKNYRFTIMKISQYTQCIIYFANYAVSSKKYDFKILCVTRKLTKSSSQRRKTNQISLYALLYLWYAQHVLGTMPIIRSSRLTYVCYCHLWCAVL